MKEAVRREVVTHYLDRAIWLAQQDRFEEARRELEAALDFADPSPALVERVREVKDKVETLHQQRVQTLSQMVESVLQLQPVKVSQEHRTSVEQALEALNKIGSSDVQALNQRWEKHYQKAISARSSRFRRLMNQVRACSEEKRFKEALDALQKAHQFADEEQLKAVEETGQKIEKQRQIYAELLTRELEGLFAKGPEGLNKADLDRGQAILAELIACDLDRLELEILSERWQAYQRRREVSLHLQNTRQRLEKLWHSPFMLLDRYEEAMALARHTSETYPNEQGFQELLQEAKMHWNEAHRKVEALIVQVNQGNFKDIIDELERLYHEGHKQLPRFEWEAEGLVLTGNMPAQEAINHLSNLAQEYASRKAEEYKEKAVETLAGDPKQAADWIEQALSLEFLPSAEREELQAYYDKVISTALEQQERALQLLEEAKERRPEDLEAAWDLVIEAGRLAPRLREVNKTREYLSPWLKVHWNTLLRKAEAASWDGDLETARRLADSVLGRTQNLPGFEDVYQKAQQIVERCQKV